MHFTDYMRKANDVTGVSRNLARVTTVLGADAPTTAITTTGPTMSMKQFLREVGASRPRDIKDGVGTLAGAGLGLYLFRKHHPVLGVIGGASLGRNVPALLHAEDRSYALKNLFSTGGGVLGSLWWQAHPAIGFVLGNVVASVLARWKD